MNKKNAGQRDSSQGAALWRWMLGLVLLFAGLGFLILQELLGFQRGPIDFAEQELRGIEYQKGLESVLKALMIYEHQLTYESVGRLESVAQEQSAEPLIDEAFSGLNTIHERLGRYLGFSEGELVRKHREHFQPRILFTEWVEFKGKSTLIDPVQQEAGKERLRHLTSDVFEMIRYVGDTSNLILDPDLDSYYLINSLLNVLPQVQYRIGELLAADPSLLIPSKSQTQVERLKTSTMIEMMKIIDIVKLKDNYRMVLQEDDHFYGRSEGLQRLTRIHQDFTNEYSAFANVMEDSLINVVGVESGSLVASAKSVFDRSFEYWDIASQELTTFLKSRISYHRVVRLRMMTISYLSLLLVTGTSLLITRKMVIPIDEIMEDLRHQTQLAGNANKAKSQFLANMSHEIRTPLSAIIGFTEIMEDPGATQSMVVESISNIKKNSYHLLNIVNEILDLSKVESGLMAIEKTHFSLEDLLKDLVSLNASLVQSKGLQFHYRMDGNLPKKLYTDETKIKQILLNLISNAIKFSDHGVINLTVRLESQRLLAFIVSDAGRGMKREDVDKIFRPFLQLNACGSGAQKGTGLGLVLARKLAQLLGGNLVLKKSEPDGGSTFMLTVPLDFAEMGFVETEDTLEVNEERASGSPNEISNVSLRGMRVLLVDDCDDNRRLITLFLQGAGAEVEVANDGRVGIQTALNNSFDVILMDLEMPEVNGAEATSSLRSQGVRTPIVALTAHGTVEEKNYCLRHGFDNFLTRPISRDTLIRQVLRYKPQV